MKLTNLSAKQLRQVISDANLALSRREKLEKAMIEIQRVAKKHRLTRDELKTLLVAAQPSRSGVTDTPRSGRAKVAPKYQSLDGSKKWTGRGRPPIWVIEACSDNGLTIKDFKSDP